MDISPDEPSSKASVPRAARPERGGQIERLARLLEIDVGDLGRNVPLHSTRSDPARLDGHAVFDLDLAGALGRVEDSETRLHLERLLRTLETLRRGHRRGAPGNEVGDGIDHGDSPAREPAA